MFSGIHDSVLYAYAVNADKQELVLSLKPHHGSAPVPFNVVFGGVVAHCFETPQLPAILASLSEVPAAELVVAHWSAIERGYRCNGWPGPWAESLAKAKQFAETSSVRGYIVESSYGLSGWVLAGSARVVTGGP